MDRTLVESYSATKEDRPTCSTSQLEVGFDDYKEVHPAFYELPQSHSLVEE